MDMESLMDMESCRGDRLSHSVKRNLGDALRRNGIAIDHDRDQTINALGDALIARIQQEVQPLSAELRGVGPGSHVTLGGRVGCVTHGPYGPTATWRMIDVVWADGCGVTRHIDQATVAVATPAEWDDAVAVHRRRDQVRTADCTVVPGARCTTAVGAS